MVRSYIFYSSNDSMIYLTYAGLQFLYDMGVSWALNWNVWTRSVLPSCVKCDPSSTYEATSSSIMREMWSIIHIRGYFFSIWHSFIRNSVLNLSCHLYCIFFVFFFTQSSVERTIGQLGYIVSESVAMTTFALLARAGDVAVLSLMAINLFDAVRKLKHGAARQASPCARQSS